MTQDELKSSLRYSPESGAFVWNIRATVLRAEKIAGTVRTDGYIAICINRKLYLAHRLAFLYVTGAMPENVDHINGNRADNRWGNLRACTKQQNRFNLGRYRNNTSTVPGVSWHKRSRKWVARIEREGRRVSLGYFVSLDCAETARHKALLVYFGKFARQV